MWNGYNLMKISEAVVGGWELAAGERFNAKKALLIPLIKLMAC